MAEVKKTVGEVAVKGCENTTIVYTEKAEFHVAGTKSVVHRIQAEKLVAKGIATITK